MPGEYKASRDVMVENIAKRIKEAAESLDKELNARELTEQDVARIVEITAEYGELIARRQGYEIDDEIRTPGEETGAVCEEEIFRNIYEFGERANAAPLSRLLNRWNRTPRENLFVNKLLDMIQKAQYSVSTDEATAMAKRQLLGLCAKNHFLTERGKKAGIEAINTMKELKKRVAAGNASQFELLISNIIGRVEDFQKTDIPLEEFMQDERMQQVAVDTNNLCESCKGINKWIREHRDTDPNMYEIVQKEIEYGELLRRTLFVANEIGYPKVAEQNHGKLHELPIFAGLKVSLKEMHDLRGIYWGKDNHPFLRVPGVAAFMQELGMRVALAEYDIPKDGYIAGAKKELLCKCMSVPLYLWQNRGNPSFRYDNEGELTTIHTMQGAYLATKEEGTQLQFEKEIAKMVQLIDDCFDKQLTPEDDFRPAEVKAREQATQAEANPATK